MMLKDRRTAKSAKEIIDYICGLTDDAKKITLLGANKVPLGALDYREDTAGNAAAWLEYNARCLRSHTDKPFRHLVLTFEDQDKNISNEEMLKMALTLLSVLGYGNCAFYIARHDETNNAHCHITVTRGDETGVPVNEGHLHQRIVKECKRLKLEHNFAWGNHKTISEVVDFHNPKEESRYYLAHKVFESLRAINKIEDLPLELARQSNGRAVAEIKKFKSREKEKDCIQYYVWDSDREKNYSFRDRWLDEHLSYSHLKAALIYKSRMEEARETSDKMVMTYEHARDNFYDVPECSKQINELQLTWQFVDSLQKKMKTDSRKFTQEQIDMESAILYAYHLRELLTYIRIHIDKPLEQGKFKPKKREVGMSKRGKVISVKSKEKTNETEETRTVVRYSK